MESDILDLAERIALSYRIVIFCAGAEWICEIGEAEEWSAKANSLEAAVRQAARLAGYPVPYRVPNSD